MYVVEHNKPTPASFLKFPFDQMQVGSSFSVQDEADKKRAVPAAHAYGRIHNMKFKTKTTDKILTIWRVA